MTLFQQHFDVQLQHWYNLRNQIYTLDLENQCVLIDQFWQQAPFVSHYLHWSDIADWPNPWELLAENTYCHIARGLGMCYTLLLAGVEHADFIEAHDDRGEDHALVIVSSQDPAVKYTMNYYPNSVITTNLSQFKIKRTVPIAALKTKIG